MSTQDRKAREFYRRGEEILDAALALFKTDHWEHVTVDEIAKSADVAKGTIYKHFVSKDEIYARLAIRFQHLSLQRMQEVDTSMPVLERFAAYTRSAWELHLSSKELHRVFVYCSRIEFRASLPPDLLTDMQAVEAANEQVLHRLIGEGVANGEFPKMPINALLFGARAAFWGAIQLMWSGYMGEINKDKALSSLTDFMLAGIMFQDQRPAASAKLRRAVSR